MYKEEAEDTNKSNKKTWQPDKNRQHGEKNQHGVNNPRKHCKIGNNIAKKTIRRNQSQTILQKRQWHSKTDNIWKKKQYPQKNVTNGKTTWSRLNTSQDCRKLRIAHHKPYQNPGGMNWGD